MIKYTLFALFMLIFSATNLKADTSASCPRCPEKCCKDGERGPRGPVGPQGSVGPRGPTGPAGAPFVSTFGAWYLPDSITSVILSPGDIIPFSTVEV